MSGTGGILDPNTKLTTTDGQPVEVVDLIGSGGQGEVYKVRVGGVERALKWYFPVFATSGQRDIVEDLVNSNANDPRFLWPDAVVDRVIPVPGIAGFGYLMDLRSDTYAGLPQLYRRQVSTTARELLIASIHLVEAYRSLHSRGIAYRDISQGNVFFKPDSGDVLVCDNDNAILEGQETNIVGTMEFMAPELVRGDPGAKPGTQTDLHSLAVLLFQLLMNGHPLHGALEEKIHCFDENATKRLYGTKPVFIFDPSNTSNQPVPGWHDTVIATWAAASQGLRDTFTRAFSEGLHRPDLRVRETEWVNVLSHTLDAMVRCAKCDIRNMADSADLTSPGQLSDTGRACWRCDSVLRTPSQIVVTIPSPRTVRTLMVGREFEIYPHHLQAEPAKHDFKNPIAVLTAHPTDKGRFGLTNRSTDTWTVDRPDGPAQFVAPGRTVQLRGGIKIAMRGATAEIRMRTNV